MSLSVPTPPARRGDDPIAALRARLPGRVLGPADPGYDAARAGYDLANLPSPDVVVLPGSVADVVDAVVAARAAGLPVAVHGTGHNFAFAYRGGMLLNTRGLRGVRFDDAAGTVHVEAGARWRDVLPGAAARGRAALSGSSPEVGVMGYVLHGGVGWLARRYGAAVDTLRSARLVTADGRVVTASRDENPDLFWALRGAGGNFGVVVSLELELVPVAQVHGGALVFPMARAREVASAWRRWTETVPEEMTSSFTLLRLPPAPQIPEPLRGGRWAVVRACWSGRPDAAAAQLAPVRALGGIVVDTFRTMRWDESGEISQDPTEPSATRRTSLELAHLDAAALDALLNVAGDAAACPLTVVEIRHGGGALARPDAGAHVFGGRTAPFVLQTIGVAAGPLAAPVDAATRALAAAMAPFGTGTVLPGWLGGGDAGPERVRAGYDPASWPRLLALKRRWDPDNLFRLNHNLAAAYEGTAA